MSIRKLQDPAHGYLVDDILKVRSAWPFPLEDHLRFSTHCLHMVLGMG
jgi:hypothetical protein